MTLNSEMNTHAAQVIRGAIDAGYHVHSNQYQGEYELRDDDDKVVCSGKTLGDLAKEIEKAGLGL